MLRNIRRVYPTALRAVLSPALDRVSVLHRRVGLNEIDANLHMNQAVYAEVFEIGRAHWFAGTRVWSDWRRQGINPVVGRQTLTYRRELAPLQRYRLETRAVGVEGRLLMLQGFIAVGDRVHTRCDVGLLLVGPDGVLDGDAVRVAADAVITEPVAIDDWVAP